MHNNNYVNKNLTELYKNTLINLIIENEDLDQRDYDQRYAEAVNNLWGVNRAMNRVPDQFGDPRKGEGDSERKIAWRRAIERHKKWDARWHQRYGRSARSYHADTSKL